MSDVATYPLRLPRSLRANIERVSKRDGPHGWRSAA